MSRYPPSDYRGPRDRSRSPPRFSERRPSATSVFDNRQPSLSRNPSDAPRGPRSLFDGTKPPLAASSGAPTISRPSYGSLRDAPPLGSGDRGRPYRDREYDRRDRPPSPRERSPPRDLRASREYQPRDYPPRDLDVARARRASGDGPLSAGSTYSDSRPFGSAPFRGGYARGRGRGDFSFRGGRGGRANQDERDLFRRDRSPPLKRPRDLSREGREPERREDRRIERREDERRPSEWSDRERDRDFDRPRRDQLPPRLESQPSTAPPPITNNSHRSSQAPPINPARLALIESTGADISVRRPSLQQDPPAARDARREQPETPSYLNGRAETTANRYGSRDSSPPTQAPPVPAFTLSFAPSSAPTATSSQISKANPENKAQAPPSKTAPQPTVKPVEEQKPEAPAEAPTAPRAPPPAPKAHLASPPTAAPRAPRAFETGDVAVHSNRLQGVRSMDNLPGPNTTSAKFIRPEAKAQPTRGSSTSMSPAAAPALPTLIQPVSPSQPSRFPGLGAPTGPRAARMSPAQASVSPRPPFASPRSDIGGFHGASGLPRMQTPPPSAPLGPRNRSYSVSPKVASSSIPTAPKASRGPPLAPRALERGSIPSSRAPDRLVAPPPPWAPPSAPRGAQWNQWRRPDAVSHVDKFIPQKRDFSGAEKTEVEGQSTADLQGVLDGVPRIKSEDVNPRSDADVRSGHREVAQANVEVQPPKRQSSMISGHSAAQSFFGKPSIEEPDEENEDATMSEAGQENLSSTEEDDTDAEDDLTPSDLTLFHAKFERQKRLLEAQMVDLSTRHYRATTPLESIARLARISARDLERVKEQREHEMDVDDSLVTQEPRDAPQTARSSDTDSGPDLLTPKGEEERRVAIRGSDDSSEDVRRIRRASPEPVLLPYLLKDAHSPLHGNDAFEESAKRHSEAGNDLLDAMDEEMLAENDAEADIEAAFIEQYRKWREECEDLDRLKEEHEKLERQQSIEPVPEQDAPMAPPANPFEGRRLHKFNSEYEFELVLKQSEETARVEQERQDRETKKNQADLEKEAKVPDLLSEAEIKRAAFIDSNRYRTPESLTQVFSYEPAADTFTENEQQIFIAAFKETPKKWGEIASLLPNRTYEDCIRHYYTNKWDGRFRDNRTKKLKAGGRRGRGGGRGPRGRMGGLMADLATTDDFLSPDVMAEKGRPRRAAAPTTFAEKEAEAKANLIGPSPAKKPGPVPKTDANGEVVPEKPGKRQKRNGEKPGRKPKANQPLAQLAAAPQASGSPNKQYVTPLQSNEEMIRAQQLEEATLLASLQGGPRAMLNADSQAAYGQEGFMQSIPPPEDGDRAKPSAQAPSAKPSASSYWSVPEQNDFVKYIGHFGRDFAAIANHMGTKTQTMIKNHYQRQVDGGKGPELERSAVEADERRQRGEDMGPPPTPTPIIKRKYDNPQPPPQRPLIPHQIDSMDIDETRPAQRVQAPKHASPPQYQPQPRFSTSAQSTPIPAARVAPSPLPATSAPTTSQAPALAHARPTHNSLGSRLTFLSEPRSESRPNVQPSLGFHTTQEAPLRSQATQPSRTVAEAHDPAFIHNLVQERERALRIQEDCVRQEQQRHNPLHQSQLQGSPLKQPMHDPPDRKPFVDQRAPSPPHGRFPGIAFSRPSLGSSPFGSMGPAPFQSLAGRPTFNPSPPKRDEPRPGSVVTSQPAPPPAAAAPQVQPRRSNVMALLNDEPSEEPKAHKRDNLQSTAASPTTQTYPPISSSEAPMQTIPPMRRPSFGQPSLPQSTFQRSVFGQQSSTPAQPAPALKREPSTGSLSQGPKLDWAARVLSQNSPAGTPTLERDVRPYFQHHHNHRTSLLGSLNQPRANPSPPPLGVAHSRTPSLTTQQRDPPREQIRSSLPSQQQSGSHQSGQTLQPPLQSNPYGSQQSSPFPREGQSQNHAHHSHNTSLSGSFPSLHNRGFSREDHLRQEQAFAAQREREEQYRFGQREPLDIERRREEQRFMEQQQQRQREEQDQRQRQALHRPPPQPLQPSIFGGTPFGQSRSLDLRAQSRMEADMALQENERQRQQQQQQQQEADRRRQDAIAHEQQEADRYRRQQEETMFPRRPPLGNGWGSSSSSLRR